MRRDGRCLGGGWCRRQRARRCRVVRPGRVVPVTPRLELVRPEGRWVRQETISTSPASPGLRPRSAGLLAAAAVERVRKRHADNAQRRVYRPASPKAPVPRGEVGLSGFKRPPTFTLQPVGASPKRRWMAVGEPSGTSRPKRRGPPGAGTAAGLAALIDRDVASSEPDEPTQGHVSWARVIRPSAWPPVVGPSSGRWPTTRFQSAFTPNW